MIISDVLLVNRYFIFKLLEWYGYNGYFYIWERTHLKDLNCVLLLSILTGVFQSSTSESAKIVSFHFLPHLKFASHHHH